MNNKKEIIKEEDIVQLVHCFYNKIRKDECLSPVFNHTIQHNWDAHLQTMVDFWSTLLLYTNKYLNDPMSKHLKFAIEKKHFEKWLYLFEQTVDELFVGEVAVEAKKRAHTIALLMQHAISLKNE